MALESLIYNSLKNLNNTLFISSLAGGDKWNIVKPTHKVWVSVCVCIYMYH